jgi:hypothetical protein
LLRLAAGLWSRHLGKFEGKEWERIISCVWIFRSNKTAVRDLKHFLSPNCRSPALTSGQLPSALFISQALTNHVTCPHDHCFLHHHLGTIICRCSQDICRLLYGLNFVDRLLPPQPHLPILARVYFHLRISRRHWINKERLRTLDNHVST